MRQTYRVGEEVVFNRDVTRNMLFPSSRNNDDRTNIARGSRAVVLEYVIDPHFGLDYRMIVNAFNTWWVKEEWFAPAEAETELKLVGIARIAER